MSILKELLSYFISKRKYWIIPLIILFTLIGLLFVIAQGSVITPLIYTLF